LSSFPVAICKHVLGWFFKKPPLRKRSAPPVPTAAASRLLRLLLNRAHITRMQRRANQRCCRDRAARRRQQRVVQDGNRRGTRMLRTNPKSPKPCPSARTLVDDLDGPGMRRGRRLPANRSRRGRTSSEGNRQGRAKKKKGRVAPDLRSCSISRMEPKRKWPSPRRRRTSSRLGPNPRAVWPPLHCGGRGILRRPATSWGERQAGRKPGIGVTVRYATPPRLAASVTANPEPRSTIWADGQRVVRHFSVGPERG